MLAHSINHSSQSLSDFLSTISLMIFESLKVPFFTKVAIDPEGHVFLESKYFLH